MKRILLFSLLLPSLGLFAQTNTFPTSGNVGIGTTSPQGKLHVSTGTSGDAIFRLEADTDNNNEADNPLIQLRQDGGQLGVNIGYSEENFGGNIFGIGTRYSGVEKWDAFTLNTQNGNVGVSTTPLNSKLSIGDTTNDQLALIQSTGSQWQFRVGSTGSLIFKDDGAEKMRLDQTGNIGIGTSNPNSKLSIYLSGATSTYPTSSTRGDVIQTLRSNNNGLEFGNSRGTNDRKAWILARHSSASTYGKYFSSLHLQPDVGDKSQYKGVAIGYQVSSNLPIGTHLAVNGKVGIGTTTPDAELAVNGNIHAKEVKVDLVGWPDYVFKEDYDLPTLEEVENHIKEKGHLMNIPSAKEVEKNGVQLGEMNKLLLEKIEELTLYTIEQQKLIQKILNQNILQEKQLKTLRKGLK